ncbi:TPA: Rha family transcriptional regulator [Salmonella enterica]|nr:Rha family transcriptional regulator [Salmonella enterica]
MTNPISTVIPEITIHNNRAVTTSIAVANYFEKSHDNVLKKIRAVMFDCPPSYHVVNFNEVVREVPGGDGAVRKMPMFELTRDAFVLIVMGFTGKKALQWKIDYITAFNAMEAELSKPVVQTGYSELVITLQNGQPVCSRVGQPGEFMSTLEGHTEMLRRAGYVVTHCDDLELLTVADLAKRAGEARQLMNKWMAINS